MYPRRVSAANFTAIIIIIILYELLYGLTRAATGFDFARSWTSKSAETSGVGITAENGMAVITVRFTAYTGLYRQLWIIFGRSQSSRGGHTDTCLVKLRSALYTTIETDGPMTARIVRLARVLVGDWAGGKRVGGIVTGAPPPPGLPAPLARDRVYMLYVKVLPRPRGAYYNWYLTYTGYTCILFCLRPDTTATCRSHVSSSRVLSTDAT